MQVSTTRLYQQVHILHSRSFRSSTDQLLHLLEVCRWYTSLQSGIGDDKVAALSIEADCDCGLAHGGQVEESLSFQVGSSTGFQSWLIIGPSTPGHWQESRSCEKGASEFLRGAPGGDLSVGRAAHERGPEYGHH